ncbi:DUF2711 family protein [Bacillus salacetis]|uniref:DUF2711 family protein n=1 Tax=Bacillus salacetis TaxID=2315464 RepID=A0A3A1QSN8_9BACI|nr:DUF2711 family protein [Bacillus salacetis]RIW30407.1 DUF2711 family protein [Bacillus salacetis]
MKFFYPLGDDSEKDPLLNELPDQYKFAASLFFPFVKMPDGWKSEESYGHHAYYPIREDIFKYGKPIVWEDLRKKCGFSSMAEMSIAATALLTGCMGRELYRRPDLMNRLENVLEEDVYTPFEDSISILLIDALIKVLVSKGAKRLRYHTLYDEQGICEIEEIDLEAKLTLCSDPITITDENEDFVLSCFFDEWAVKFFAKEDATNVLAENGLEGIIFTDKTPIVWENHPYHVIKNTT